MVLCAFPQGAMFGKVLPKNKVYEHARPSTRIKNLFVAQVEQIVWQYKLSPETCNMQATPAVSEIQVFSITLKGEELAWDVLHCIDQAVPSPLLFELHREQEVQVAAAYKRKNEADSSKWVLGDYFASTWLPTGTPRSPLPLGLTLEGLYAYLLQQLLPYPTLRNETLQKHMERVESIKALERERERIEIRMNKEQQFNRKVELKSKMLKVDRTLKEFMSTPTNS